MVRIAWSMAAVLLACGVMAAQSDTPKSGTGQVNVQSWKGTLVDANCANGGSQAAKESSDSKGVDSGRPEKGHKKSHSETEGCLVSSSTTAFAIKTKEGQVMKFDAIGNSRAAEQLKTKASWSKDVAAGKPIHATVSGILNGDSITVISI